MWYRFLMNSRLPSSERHRSRGRSSATIRGRAVSRWIRSMVRRLIRISSTRPTRTWLTTPTLTPAGYLWPVNTTPADRVNPNFGRVNATLWQANSFYHAMQVDLAKRVGHGVQFHVAYTWGKSIDTLSASEADDSYPNGLFNQPFFDQRTTRGLSDFNVPQTLVVSATWEIPAPAKDSKLPGWAFGGWQIVGLYKASSGQPFTPIMGGDPLGTQLDET